MTAQLSLFGNYLKSTKKKRVHFKTPTYKKFYSVKRYDRHKFRHYLNFKLKGYKCIRPLNQNDILKLCYLKDEYGNQLYDGDEKHIFRYSALHYAPDDDKQKTRCKYRNYGIHELIYNKIRPDSDNDIIETNNVVCYPDERQAEIKNTWQLPLTKRIKIHIRLLWLLDDYNLKQSMEWMNEVDIKRL